MRRREERGSALVLAILVVFSMLALGLVAMRDATLNISGSGNQRMNKQARYVAELGLHHSMTLMNRMGSQILNRVRGPNYQSILLIESDGRVAAVRPEDRDNPLGVWNLPPPDLLDNALGHFGMQPSYRVEVDGFTFIPDNVGNDGKAAMEGGEGRCMMHFTAHGYIANVVLPSPEQLDADERFAEFTLKAAAPLPAYAVDCRRW